MSWAAATRRSDSARRSGDPEAFGRCDVAYWPVATFRTYALNGRFPGEADVDRWSLLADRDANDLACVKT